MRSPGNSLTNPVTLENAMPVIVVVIVLASITPASFSHLSKFLPVISVALALPNFMNASHFAFTSLLSQFHSIDSAVGCFESAIALL